MAVREERDYLAKMIPRNEQKEAAWRAIEIIQRQRCPGYGDAAKQVNNLLGRELLSPKMVQREMRRLNGRIYLTSPGGRGDVAASNLEFNDFRPPAPTDCREAYERIMRI